jgi:DNA-directed RNA polymerase subunit beta'
MKNYIYQNNLIGKKQLRQILGWSFTNYDSMQACSLADELKYLGFKYATIAGISISIEDLRVPFIKNLMLEKANQEIINSEKIFLKGKITEVERFQKIIDTWSLTSESLKDQVINYFKKYDPLNSVYIMAFSGARGNLSQVRQLVGMRGLMSDPSGEIMNLPIKQNFREGLTITDYLMSGYGARKGIVDTALKTANSGYLTRRLIDVAQDILIREKDCQTNQSILVLQPEFSKKIIGRVLNKSIKDPKTLQVIAEKNSQITPLLFDTLQQKKIPYIYLRSPLTCQLYRAVCQQCYGWDLSTENLVDIGEAVGILAGQSIGEPGTQLTMRTFHTGGIFTSEARQQIISPVNGIIRFSKFLETIVLRTNRGEDVLVTKNSGSLILIPDSFSHPISKIELSRNTILFPKHNQYIQKDTVIGELINTNKQLKREVKPILAYTSGEIIIPKLKTKLNSLNNNKLLWLLSGELFNSPKNSYINFYSDYKLNKESYIFRTKIVNSYSGFVKYKNSKKSLYERQIILQNKNYSLFNSNLQHLAKNVSNFGSILNFNKRKYFLNTTIKSFKIYLKVTRKQKFAKLITNFYTTRTGGTVFYDWRNISRVTNIKNKIYFYNNNNDYQLLLDKENNKKSKTNSKEKDFDIPFDFKKFENDFEAYYSKNYYRTLVWLEEETHHVNCEPNILLVKNGDFISEGFEITPDQFSKTSGLVLTNQKNNIIQTLTIKSGLIYEGKKISNKVKSKKIPPKSKKLFFPGEQIFSTININVPSLCEQIAGRNGAQLLIRPIKLYEFPCTQKIENVFKNQNFIQEKLKFGTNTHFVYQSNQKIQTNQSLNLVTEFLYLKIHPSFLKDLTIELKNNKIQRSVTFNTINKLSLNNYVSPTLKYKNLESCLLIQNNQFIDIYTTLVYLESTTHKPLEIVKVKVNQQDIKQILLISNENCITIEKNKLPTKKINDFIINSINTNHVGKIIIDNDRFFTIQKGRPYFFPKCKTEELNTQSNLQYKTIPSKRITNKIKTSRKLFLNHYDRLKILVETNPKISTDNLSNWETITNNFEFSLKIKFSKMFLKRNGKLYSCMIPRFLKQFTIGINPNTKVKSSLIDSNLFSYPKLTPLKLDRTLLIRNSEIDLLNSKHPRLTFVKFMEYPFTKSTKSIGLYSITEDLFEQELNSVFCQNNQFLEDGNTIGLLNLEKEITGDIVQGLPRIEEILEARKKNQVVKRIPISQKKGLLTQRTSLDENFEFHKLGTPIRENEKINPHKLIKVYFNYYGFLKPFFCDKEKSVKYVRLLNNFEGNYKSFKKVQSFILNSVQGVYESQGVTINDKHIEVIIKQMTTKVLITDEGDTPLLKREVIDLYHIQYINKIVEKEQKQPAYYLPLLFGITRAALNNPSFISAASFQETTKVLTKAAIEGRIDWLRGLKENIIIGHLIPSGTGSRNFKTAFKKPALMEIKELSI